jgi:threonine dehydrogenase-like Zn-dependent dehydrogenase
MELFAGVFEFVAFLVSTRRGQFWLLVAFIAIGMIAAALNVVESSCIDPSFVITDRASLEDGPALYQTVRDRQNGCIKVVMKP